MIENTDREKALVKTDVSGSGFLISETLTGKCKDDFWDFVKNKKRDYHLCKNWSALPESCKNALFLEFFDSVDIKISIHFETFGN